MTITTVIHYLTGKGTEFFSEREALECDEKERFTEAYLKDPITYKNTAEMGEAASAPADKVMRWIKRHKDEVNTLLHRLERPIAEGQYVGYFHVLACVELKETLPESKAVTDKVSTAIPARRIRIAAAGEVPSFWGVFENQAKQLVQEFGEKGRATTFCEELNRRKERNSNIVWRSV